MLELGCENATVGKNGLTNDQSADHKNAEQESSSETVIRGYLDERMIYFDNEAKF